MIKILFLAVASSFLLSSCAGLGVAANYAQDKWTDAVQRYCVLPTEQRKIARGIANDPLNGEALILISCKADKDFEVIFNSYIAPYQGYDVQAAILNKLLEEGSYTLPDGTILKIVAE